MQLRFLYGWKRKLVQFSLLYFPIHSCINNRFFHMKSSPFFCLTGKYILTYYSYIARNCVYGTKEFLEKTKMLLKLFDFRCLWRLSISLLIGCLIAILYCQTYCSKHTYSYQQQCLGRRERATKNSFKIEIKVQDM